MILYYRKPVSRKKGTLILGSCIHRIFNDLILPYYNDIIAYDA